MKHPNKKMKSIEPCQRSLIESGKEGAEMIYRFICNIKKGEMNKGFEFVWKSMLQFNHQGVNALNRCVLIALNIITRVKRVKIILHAGVQDQELSKEMSDPVLLGSGSEP